MAEPESMVFVVDDDPSVCRSIERLISFSRKVDRQLRHA
jgi:hypothetical protein